MNQMPIDPGEEVDLIDLIEAFEAGICIVVSAELAASIVEID
jgi:hypothetical protein